MTILYKEGNWRGGQFRGKQSLSFSELGSSSSLCKSEHEDPGVEQVKKSRTKKKKD